eukprot:scaffold8508_cov104-Skeletonema_dohrnii-CCMP3373.AAC.1
MPHQVTYDVVATPIRPNTAGVRYKRYGCQKRSWGASRMPHQVTYDVVATSIRPNTAGVVNKILLYYHGQLAWPTVQKLLFAIFKVLQTIWVSKEELPGISDGLIRSPTTL